MTNDTQRHHADDGMSTSASAKVPLLVTNLRDRLWNFGSFAWMVALIDRSLALFAAGTWFAIALAQVLLVALLFIVWLYLKPAKMATERLSADQISTLKHYKLSSTTPQHAAYRHQTEARMLQLEKYHLITQEYVLPIPYLCQIYHLLNLKHLESVHGFSLNNLKVIDVSQFEATAIGGSLKFQTVLEASPNVLSLVRQPVVEVELTLHTPYTIELSIPVHNGNKIAVLFNVLPLSQNEHKLFIDIYSNLALPRPLLQIALHLAAGLTVFEDLPYLQKLNKAKIHRSAQLGQVNHKTMQLFKRFVDLYGSSLEQPQAPGAVELQPIYTATGAIG
ncbi:hypothetical protein H6F86_25745 [Phormidium sp. FACHB-592]|uniref:Uncharacterized protein n=1 Tax=Stenomitos frigidus AS-A4 TaxID=2933935 RepID=A0ABV0KT29_9CYAN|nr:hypothetical protein [Phormidium sp. FACHB-592]MBD2077220.1 hypothetical protein [Phormidium sp. FACHB-592]